MITPTRKILFTSLILSLFLVAAVVLASSGPPFDPVEQLMAADGGEGDLFGSDVAQTADTAAIGAPGWVKEGQRYVGSVYIFTHSAAGWDERTQIIHDDGRAGDIFGASVALDGGTLGISAPYRDILLPTRVSDVGAIVVYTGAADLWTKQTTLMPDDLVANNYFGFSLDLDGDTLIAGAPNLESADNEAAYVYRRDGGTWTLEDKLTAPGSPADFGSAVAVAGDVALVGAPGPTQEGSATPLVPGAVFVFSRSGSDWIPAGTLTPAESEAGDNFGCAIDFDGQKAVIVACEAYGMTPDPGEAYVFVRDGATWSQQARLTPTVDGYPLDLRSAALDGDRLVLGADHAPAPESIGTDRGAVFVYEWNGTEWLAVQTIHADDGQDGDAFGTAVALVGDALLVGAPDNGVLNVPKQGTVYAFGPDSGTGEDAQVYLPVVIGRPPGPVQPGSADTILYAVNDTDDGGIHSIRANGTNRLRLTQGDHSDIFPRWSPDRRHIAFVRSLPSSAAQLMVMNADGSGARVIPTPNLDMMGALSWSPDGLSLVFNAYTKYTKWDIYRIDLDGQDLTNLTANLPGSTMAPDWSPDGKRIVFTHRANVGYGPFDLWLINPDGSDPVNLTNDETGQFDPAWSPDGQTILYAQQRETNGADLVTMPATGGAPTLVIELGEMGRWSPDGRQIVFSGTSGTGGIYRVSADGTSLLALDENVNSITPDW